MSINLEFLLLLLQISSGDYSGLPDSRLSVSFTFDGLPWVMLIFLLKYALGIRLERQITQLAVVCCRFLVYGVAFSLESLSLWGITELMTLWLSSGKGVCTSSLSLAFCESSCLYFLGFEY